VAALAAAFDTLRMVPSTGWATLDQASSSARVIAAARPWAPIPETPVAAASSAKPRKIWLRITPEFPRAVRSRARAKTSASVARSASLGGWPRRARSSYSTRAASRAASKDR
jgi:hypothetical protein